ncbi:acyltransferase family protein [Oryzihumus sp.]
MSTRRPALDGVRALAVLAVVVYHLGGGAGSALPGGFLGVDAFFVLSGYLITSLLLAEHQCTGRVDLAAFWVRRVRRLFPALAVVLLACAGWVWWHGPVEQWSARRGDLLATLAYAANWHFAGSGEDYFAAYTGASPLRHTWSLAVEEQFYLLWPALVWAVLSLALRRRARRGGPAAVRQRELVLGTVALTALVASSLAMGLEHALLSPSRAYYGTEGRVQELAVGVLLAVAVRRWRARPGGHGRAAAVAGAGAGLAALLAGFALLPDSSTLYYRGGALLVCLAVAAVIGGVELAPGSRLATTLSWRPLVAVGTLSYGIYLWHWPVVVALPVEGPHDATWWARQALRVALTGALAVASWRLVERPVQQGRMPWARRSASRVTALAALTSALVAGVAVTATALPPPLDHQLAQRSDSPCPAEASDPLASCVKVDGGSRSVVLFGDSTARALDPGLQPWARQHDARYVQAAWVRCTPTGLLVVPDGSPGPDAPAQACHERARQQQLAVLDAERAAGRHPLVLVAEYWSHHQGLVVGGQRIDPGTASHDATLRAAYRRLVREVAARGGRVAFVTLPPPGPSLGTVIAPDRPAGSAEPLALGGEFVDGYNRVLRQVAASSHGRAVVVDVDDLVCPGGQCQALQDGTVVRSDGVHWTVAYAQRLAPVVLARADAALAG